jgi:prepilin-type N-terminal cleavage/methylation domain-containing protein
MKGYTLIELIIVIAIVGIVGVVVNDTLVNAGYCLGGC